MNVYAQGRDQELVPLDKNEPLNQDTILVTISPVLGAALVAPADTTLRMFWKGAAEDFAGNLRLGFPILLLIGGYLFATAALMLDFESSNPDIKTYWDALYLTWVTMTTVGYGDIAPKSPSGRLLASADGLVGIVLIGVVLWLVTESLKRE